MRSSGGLHSLAARALCCSAHFFHSNFRSSHRQQLCRDRCGVSERGGAAIGCLSSLRAFCGVSVRLQLLLSAVWRCEVRTRLCSSYHTKRLLRSACAAHCKNSLNADDIREKLVMTAPYSGPVDSMRSLFKQQRSVVTDYICVPVVMFRRNCQNAVFFLRKLASQPLLLYTVFWTLMLAAAVTVAALSLEMGFSTGISSHTEIAEACALQSNKASPSCRQCFRLPLDGPRDGLCVPANMFKKSRIDFAVPPIFAALVVTASALFVQGLGLWSY